MTRIYAPSSCLYCSQHGTCPACRHSFLDVNPVSESDNESSDEDYIPGEDDFDEDEDIEFEFTDNESDFNLELDPRALQEFVDALAHLAGEDEVDGDSMRNWGLSDGDSLSDEDLSLIPHDGPSEMDDGKLVHRMVSRPATLTKSPNRGCIRAGGRSLR